MGYWRFHRSVGNKFVRLNLSKTGFSLTSGVPGAHVNIPFLGKRRRRTIGTLSIPGTGLSYRQHLGPRPSGGRRSGDNPFPVIVGLVLMVVLYLLFHGGF